jgi:O-antigen/teichoic acid export membrane protein
MLLSLIIVLIVSKSSKPEQFFRQALSKRNFKLHWEYARPSFFSNILAELSAYADILFINFLITDIYGIGQYSFALTLTVLYRILPSTVQQITTPYFSGLSNNKFSFSQAYKKYSKLLILIIIVCLILGVLLVPPIIAFLFDGKFNATFKYFIPLSIGWSIRQFNQIQSAALFGLGKINYIANSQLLSLFFNIIVIYISLHFWGLQGVSYASIICSVFAISVVALYLKKAKRGYEDN